MAGAEQARLRELICGDWQRAHDVEIRTEVVKGPVWVAKDFDVHRRLADVLSIRFDAGAGRRGIYQHNVGHGVVGTAFSAWRNGGPTSCKYDHRGQARGGNPLGTHTLKIASNSEFLNRNSPQPQAGWVSLLPCVCVVVGDVLSCHESKDATRVHERKKRFGESSWQCLSTFS